MCMYTAYLEMEIYPGEEKGSKRTLKTNARLACERGDLETLVLIK